MKVLGQKERLDEMGATAVFVVYDEPAGRLAAPGFDAPVAWRRAGDLQVHLYGKAGGPDCSGHFALEVDHPDAERWRSEIPEMVALADIYPQPGGAAEATLFLPQR